MSGSHSDTVKLGGPYDGALGVIGAISAIKFLRDQGFQPVKSIECIMFTTEEASRFSIPCLGRHETAPMGYPFALISLALITPVCMQACPVMLWLSLSPNDLPS